MKLTKHVVIATNIRTEFLDAAKAAAYALEVGGTVEIVEEEIIEPEPVKEPREVASWRLRAILTMQGMADSVTGAISQLPEPNKTVAQLAWEYAPTIDRYSETVLFAQQQLQLTDEQVDALFDAAEAIEI
jgi:hypothetical protein